MWCEPYKPPRDTACSCSIDYDGSSDSAADEGQTYPALKKQFGYGLSGLSDHSGGAGGNAGAAEQHPLLSGAELAGAAEEYSTMEVQVIAVGKMARTPCGSRSRILRHLASSCFVGVNIMTCHKNGRVSWLSWRVTENYKFSTPCGASGGHHPRPVRRGQSGFSSGAQLTASGFAGLLDRYQGRSRPPHEGSGERPRSPCHEDEPMGLAAPH